MRLLLYQLLLTPSATEEMLIDFRELVGEHSGENMAEAVWTTLKNYGIEGRVRSCTPIFIVHLKTLQIVAVVMDNASNNDTLVAGLEGRCDAAGISWFDARQARIRCLPHTVHLAALKVYILYRHLQISN